VKLPKKIYLRYADEERDGLFVAWFRPDEIYPKKRHLYREYRLAPRRRQSKPGAGTNPRKLVDGKVTEL